MKKKILSLCTALVLCLGLLPVSALATGGSDSRGLSSGISVKVGTSSSTTLDDEGYTWENDNGVCGS